MSASPDPDCRLCPRLAGFRDDNRAKFPDFHNGPVENFGNDQARLLIAGLAPGLRGANRTGRPFTGDYAGDLLYPSLVKFGFADGVFDARPDDSLVLKETLITNVVRCVPPENKPIGAEINNCRPFLASLIDRLQNLKAILCLGRISHDSCLRALGVRLKDAPFGHGAQHSIGKLTLYDSYHCSRYNVNTGRLTEQMFHAVVAQIRDGLTASA